MSDLDHVPEPARAALRFIAMHQHVHPDIKLSEAAAVARMLGEGEQLLSWRDDRRGRFEVYLQDRPVLMLDLTPFEGRPEHPG